MSTSKMGKLRLLLLPFGGLYGLIALLRNWLYTKGIFTSRKTPVPSICVGNLSTGGTGKTPLIDYLITHYEARQVKVATLSRGYGRNTKGERIATPTDSPNEIGDEPAMYGTRHPSLVVAVAEDRNAGAELLMKAHPDLSLILLDDAYQHRAIQAGLSILVTEYARPFFKDFMLPAGDLREPRVGRRRADAIVVSKCPELTPEAKSRFVNALNMGDKPVFFAHIAYDHLKGFQAQGKETLAKNILLVTGIGNPAPLLEHFQKNHVVTHLKFRDHHAFTAEDIRRIHEKFDTFASLDKIIVTTEKDAMRILGIHDLSNYADYWFYQPIQMRIEEEREFKQLLDDYADKI